MIIRVLRFHGTSKATGGVLSVDGNVIGFTCEDEKREVKIKNETRIPAGMYEIKMRKKGAMHEKYAKKFKNHAGMLELQNVLGFTYIYIHIGNRESETSGCILVGLTYSIIDQVVGSSTLCYLKLYDMVLNALANDEKIYCQVVDELI